MDVAPNDDRSHHRRASVEDRSGGALGACARGPGVVDEQDRGVVDAVHGGVLVAAERSRRLPYASLDRHSSGHYGCGHESYGWTADGTWQFGVRRTIPLGATGAWARLDTLLEGDDAVGETRSETPGVVRRLTYQMPGWPAPATLQLRVMPTATGSTLAVHLEQLPDAAAGTRCGSTGPLASRI